MIFSWMLDQKLDISVVTGEVYYGMYITYNRELCQC